jgi:hypothetical protein
MGSLLETVREGAVSSLTILVDDPAIDNCLVPKHFQIVCERAAAICLILVHTVKSEEGVANRAVELRIVDRAEGIHYRRWKSSGASHYGNAACTVRSHGEVAAPRAGAAAHISPVADNRVVWLDGAAEHVGEIESAVPLEVGSENVQWIRAQSGPPQRAAGLLDVVEGAIVAQIGSGEIGGVRQLGGPATPVLAVATTATMSLSRPRIKLFIWFPPQTLAVSSADGTHLSRQRQCPHRMN